MVGAYEHLGDPVEVGVLVVLVDGHGRDPGGPIRADGLPQEGVLRQSEQNEAPASRAGPSRAPRRPVSTPGSPGRPPTTEKPTGQEPGPGSARPGSGHAEAGHHRLDGRRPPGLDSEACKQRNTVERCINRLKQWRGPTTRTDKLTTVYQAALHLAGIPIWTRR